MVYLVIDLDDDSNIYAFTTQDKADTFMAVHTGIDWQCLSLKVDVTN